MQKSNFNCVKTQNVLVLLILALSTTIGVLPCRSQMGSPQESSPDMDWITETWTGNDVPYRRIRDGIDQRIARGENAALIAFNLEKRESDPFDTKAQFKWAYAAYKSVRGPNEGNPEKEERDIQTLSHIMFILERAHSATVPHSYEYSRLRFLATARFIADRTLKPLGERLLKRNPKDLEVMLWQVSVLDPKTYKEDEAPSLFYMRTLIQAQPKSSTYRLLLGGVYFKMWLYRVKHHSIDEPFVANQAIAAYNQFLQVAPPNYHYRKEVQERINNIRQVRLRFKSRSRR